MRFVGIYRDTKGKLTEGDEHISREKVVAEAMNFLRFDVVHSWVGIFERIERSKSSRIRLFKENRHEQVSHRTKQKETASVEA